MASAALTPVSSSGRILRGLATLPSPPPGRNGLATYSTNVRPDGGECLIRL